MSSFLHINGLAVPIKECEPGYAPIAGGSGYNSNGFYQHIRNGTVRAWRCRTSLLTSDMRIALGELLSQDRQDAWRWDLAADPDGVAYIVDDTDTEVYSDAKRIPVSTEAECTVVAAYASDGTRVYDWNGEPYGVFSGCSGALLVEPSTGQMLTVNNSHPTSNAHLVNISGGVHQNETVRHWRANNCVYITTTGADVDGVATGTYLAYTSYTPGDKVVFSVYIAPDAGGEAVELYFEEDTGAGLAQAGTPVSLTLPSDVNQWRRYYVAYTTSGSSVSLRGVMSNRGATGAQKWYAGGLMMEVQSSGYPTAWILANQDPWGAGNGNRPGGILDFPTFVTGWTDGFTVAAWVNVQKLSNGSQYVFDTGDGAPRAYCYFDSGNRFNFIGQSKGLALLQCTGTARTAGWYHVASVYDRKTNKGYLYVNGVEDASDTTWVGRIQDLDLSQGSDYFSWGTTGTAGAFTAPGPIGPTMCLPFAAPAEMILGMYNSGADQLGVPGAYPMTVTGDALGTSERFVRVYSKVDSMPHIEWEKEGVWQKAGGEIAFTLMEAQKR